MSRDLRSYEAVVALARRQDDAVTRQAARELGMSDQAIALRRRLHGWTSPVRESLVVPPVRDPLRAHARAATLVAGGTVCGVTAAYIHGLEGLPRRVPTDPVDLAVPDTPRRHQRRGCRRHWTALQRAEITDVGGIPVTTVVRTCEDVLLLTEREIAVGVLDAALRTGRIAASDIRSMDARLRARMCSHSVRGVLALVDGRAESPLETRLRLLLVDAGLVPPELQFLVRRPDTGEPVARLDFAWPHARLAVEADGVGPHSEPQALLRDRERQNALVGLGWIVLRFTWHDVIHRPEYVIECVRRELAESA